MCLSHRWSQLSEHASVQKHRHVNGKGRCTAYKAIFLMRGTHITNTFASTQYLQHQLSEREWTGRLVGMCSQAACANRSCEQICSMLEICGIPEAVGGSYDGRSRVAPKVGEGSGG